METVKDRFLGPQNHCSHEIKTLAPWKKSYDQPAAAAANLDSILKSRDITLPTKVRLVKAIAFHVVMYGCESWAER